MNRILRLSIFLLISLNLSAQITGTVKDANNQPLPFVNVIIENTYKGTTTNDDGYYELNISEKGTYTIVFSYLGFKTKKEKINIEEFPFSLEITLQEGSLMKLS